MLKLLSFVSVIFFTLIQADDVNWKTMKHKRTKDLKLLQSQRSSRSIEMPKLNYYGKMKQNEGHFQRALENILIERVSGSDGNKKVRDVSTKKMGYMYSICKILKNYAIWSNNRLKHGVVICI